MIVKMSKVFVVGRRRDRDRLLDALRDLGAVHLKPVDPPAAVAKERTLAGIDHLGRAIQLLADIEPAGDAPDLTALEAAEETLEIQRKCIERQGRLAALHRQIEQLDLWGDLRLEQLQKLRDGGIDVRLVSVAPEDAAAVEAECVQPLGELPDGRALIAVATRAGEVDLPEDALEIEPPPRDRPALRAEAAEIDAALAADARRETRLAHCTAAMRTALGQLEQEAQYTVAQRGGLADEHLFALQGWIPADQTDGLTNRLAQAGVDAAVERMDPAEEEDPPTLIRHCRWVRPIQALFDILGTVPGYREMDLSPFFMVALPVFAAMLIGDAGYGMIFTLIGLGAYRKIKAKAGPAAAQLVLVFGLVMLAWGMLSANYFGITPETFRNDAGEVVGFGKILAAVGVLWNPDATIARNTIIKISFIFGCLHLVLAHLRAALDAAPNVKCLAEIGWAAFLVGMLGVVWSLFFKDEVWMPQSVMIGLLAAGAALLITFSFPSRNPLKMFGLGILSNILPMIGAFSDTMSYIRLMAVGLASYYIAKAFNDLGCQVAAGSVLLILPGALIIVFAHALNITLGLIAIFAHGVRLNMLEFSSNAGVQWVGYPYAPFAKTAAEGER